MKKFCLEEVLQRSDLTRPSGPKPPIAAIAPKSNFVLAFKRGSLGSILEIQHVVHSEQGKVSFSRAAICCILLRRHGWRGHEAQWPLFLILRRGSKRKGKMALIRQKMRLCVEWQCR